MVNLGVIGAGIVGMFAGSIFFITFSDSIRIIGVLFFIGGFLAILFGFYSNGSTQGTQRGK